AVVGSSVAGLLDFARRQRLDKTPMIFAANQPAEPLTWLIKEGFLPKVLDPFDIHAADHEADAGEFDVAKSARFSERNHRSDIRRLESFEENEIALVDVQQRIATGAGDALRLVGSVET